MVRLLTAALLLSSCSPAAVRTELKGETTISGDPAQPPLAAFPTVAALASVDLRKHPEVQAAGLAEADISSVKVDSVRLRIVSPPSEDFSWLESVTWVAKSGDLETVVAEKTGIAALGLTAPNPSLQLDVKPHELKGHVQAPSISFLGRTKGRHPKTDTRVEVMLGLRVEAGRF